MHTRVQLDPTQKFFVREGADGTVEICVLSDDYSLVIEMSYDQYDTLRESTVSDPLLP